MDDTTLHWDHVQPVAGESHYQETLRQIRAAGLETFTAMLDLEPDNPHDPNAVAVCGPMRQRVGYLARPIAERAHAALADRLSRAEPLRCPAKLIGGSEDKPSLGVLLHGPTFELLTTVPSRLKQCPYCAEDIQQAAIVCKHCNRDLRLPVAAPMVAPLAAQAVPSSGVAAVLSLVIPGAGHMYKGHLGVGFVFFFGTVIGYVLFIIPGLLLHILAVVTAAAVSPRIAATPAKATPQSVERAAQADAHQRRVLKRVAIAFLGYVLLIALLFLIYR